jgi:predicted glycosyltransferase
MSLFQTADAIVCMAGYNTCAEVMRCAKPAVFLPRTTPRREQALRAQRLERLGLGRCLVEPEPAALADAVEGALATEIQTDNLPALDGAKKLCEITRELTEAVGQPRGRKSR